MHAFLRRPWGFSRALGCGARKGAARTPRRKWGSRSGSVARDLGVQSREIWQGIAELLSDLLEQPGTCKPPKSFFFFFPLSAAVLEVPQQCQKARQPRPWYHSHALLFPLHQPRTVLLRVCEFVSVRVCACPLQQQEQGTKHNSSL